MRKKYILWDLDGTIVNSEDEVLKSAIFAYACEKTGLAFNLIAEEACEVKIRKISYQKVIPHDFTSGRTIHVETKRAFED